MGLCRDYRLICLQNIPEPQLEKTKKKMVKDSNNVF